MRPRFKICLETDEIPYKTVYHVHLFLGRDCVCQQYVGSIGKSWCILATDRVRRGIRDGEGGGECTVGNLIFIVGVTPTPDAAGGVRIPESTVPKVSCVCWYEATEINDVETIRRDRTECPVPVRLAACISTFLLKGTFEVLDICTMPGQELPSEVDLGSL